MMARCPLLQQLALRETFTSPPTITPNGLGAIDLTQDAGTAFKIGLEFFDYPSNQRVQLKLRLYDATTLSDAALRCAKVVS